VQDVVDGGGAVVGEACHQASYLGEAEVARGDTLSELCNALLCTDGPVRTLVDLAHRRRHGAMYGGLNQAQGAR